MQGITRRGFLGAAVLGVGAAMAGCSSSNIKEVASADTGTSSAGVDWLGTAPEISDADIVEEKQTGILIVGAGSAGTIAAAIAAKQGADILLCEKTAAVQASRQWVGAVNTRWHEQAGIRVDGNKLLNELTRYASGRCNQAVWKVWIDESADAVADVDEIMQGYGFTAYLDTEGYDKPTGGTDFYVPPIQHMWYDAAAGGPSPLAGDMSSKHRNDVMEEFLADNGHEILYKHELVKLEQDDSGRVVAGIFGTDSGYVRITANKGILLTAGGYGSNPVMVNALNAITPEATTMNTTMPNCTGDGIRVAMRIGAVKDSQPATMIFDRGITSAGVDAGYVGEGESAAFPESGSATDGAAVSSLPWMRVNRNGKRFMNESAPYDWCTFAATKQPGGVWATVFDANVAADAQTLDVIGCAKTAQALLTMAPVEEVYAAQIEAGKFLRADTLEELAQKLDVPVDDFVAEVERYNQFCTAGVDEDFGKEAFRLKPIAQAPFYGFWCGGQFFTTLDGLQIDADMRVLKEDKTPLGGLYAAGDCAGSMYSGNYPEYIVGNRQGSAITFARHAVLSMLNKN